MVLYDLSSVYILSAGYYRFDIQSTCSPTLFWSVTKCPVPCFLTCFFPGAMVIMSGSRRTFLLFLSSAIFIMSVSALWTVFRTESTSFIFTKAVVCDEVDENFQPAGVADTYDYGTRQLCLWFEYNTEYESCELFVTWYFRNDLVFRERVNISSATGKRTLCLLREDGHPLPWGDYRVRIDLNGKNITTLNFSIENREV